MESTFNHKVKVNVRFGDIDLLHHVNNAAFCSILDEGRITYFRDVAGDLFDWNSIPFVLANINLNFVSPAHLYDKLEVSSRCTKIGNKSFAMEQEIRLRPDGQLVVSSTSTLVSFDPVKRQTYPIPTHWAEVIEQFEGRILRTLPL